MILVTGAAGKTGRAVIRALVGKGCPVRSFIRRAEQRDDVLELGATEVTVGDLNDREAVSRAVWGAEAVYHICPNVDPLELAYGRLLIEVARSAGVKRFGYHSVLHPQTERMPHHWRKMRVEEALFESGLSFTILQPAAYMQNLLAHKESIYTSGAITVPYSLEAQLSLVDLEDVAVAVATVLSETGHENAVYEIAGPDALNHLQIAAIISDEIGRPLQAEQIDRRTWAQSASQSGLGQEQISTLCSMFDYYDRFGLKGNSKVLQHLLARSPTSFRAFVKREFLP